MRVDKKVNKNIFYFRFRRAKLILRKKKYQENLLATTDKELEALEKLTNDLEFAQVQQQVLDGLQVGNEALKKIHDVLTIDEVERIMDETREGIEKQQEIDAIISTGALSQEDEDSVAAELEELVASTLPAIDEDIDDKLPEVPTEDPAAVAEKKKKKERQPEERIALEA
jgi:charged multivesicular body protein 6